MPKLHELTDIWNNAGTNFTAIEMNVDDQASLPGSKVIDLQINDVTVFSIDKNGNIINPIISWEDNTFNGILASGDDTLQKIFDKIDNFEHAAGIHAASHTDGSDDIQDATAAQKGLATSTQITKLDGIETAATADQTGAEIKSAYEGEADTNAFTDADHSKLDAIEASADVTDATNVDAAGATMNTDTDVSSNSYVLDEDDMVSNDETKLATQQSIKSYVDNSIYGGDGGTALLSGGVAWSSGLTFDVTPLEYLINGVNYTTVAGQVTLDASDPTLDRIDVIVATTSNTITKVTGTPAASPVKPDIDEATEIEITFITVAAGATTPEVSVVNIYLENAEWTAVSSDGTIVVDSTNDAYQGTKSIEATNAVNLDIMALTTGATDISTSDILEFKLKSKAAWPSTKKIQFRFYSGATPVSNWVSVKDGIYELDSSDTTNWQSILIPKASFGLSTQVVTELKMRVRGSGAAIGFFVDQIRLQEGVASAIAQPVFTNIVSDSGETNADSSTDTLKVLGAGSVSTSITDDTLTITGSGGDITTDAAWAVKGNIIVATANDAAAVLAPGSNGQRLELDSGETTGMKWVTPSGGGGLNFVDGGTYSSRSENSGASNAGGYTADYGNMVGGNINATGYGSFAHGFAVGSVSFYNANITATGLGSHATGHAYGGTIVATGDGSHAGGYAWENFTISSTAKASFAFGYAAGANIEASGYGSIAIGRTGSGFNITSSGYGSGAFGYSYPGNIAATAHNSFQFGPGTNAIADSLAVGTNFRFRGVKIDSPLTLRNGDFWMSATGEHVYVRTGTTTKKLTDIGGGGGGGLDQQGAGTFSTTGVGANAGGQSHHSTGKIYATGGGSFAHGRTGLLGGAITASNHGSIALGYAYGYGGVELLSSGQGSIAVGSIFHYGAYQIVASATGSGAFGSCGYESSIEATAENAFQFGPGTNSEPDSLQVGNTTYGIRLNGVGAVPTSLHNGDFWVDTGQVKVRTNGATKNLSDIGTGGGGGGLNQSEAGGGTTFTESSNGGNAGGRLYTYGIYTSSLIASGEGSLAHGRVNTMMMGNADITASGNGSVALGDAEGGYIVSSGIGSLAGGYATFANIQATGNGNIAWASGAAYATGAGNCFQFGQGTNTIYSSLQVGAGVNIRSDGALFLKEKTSATADVAAWGQIWVKNTTPNELWFTDDAGTDTQLGVGGGGSPLTTKGDVFGFSTVDARLAVGTNGQVLTADSAEATGLKWTTAAGGGLNQAGPGTHTETTTSSNVGGYASTSGVISATAKGSFAGGYSYFSGTITASGYGSFAHGRSYVGCSITASGYGSFATGAINSGGGESITASGHGSFAGGYALGNNITASGRGSLAWGTSNGGDIIASAQNAVQFGTGTNATADSVQIGNSISLRSSDGGSIFLKEKTTPLADVVGWGQIWVKLASPNELWFTDDAGTDHQIAFV